MSLFEDDQYRWRETFFVLFEAADLPTVPNLCAALRALGPRYRVGEPRCDPDQVFESITVVSPQDYSGFDISLIAGVEIEEQVEELKKELSGGALTAEERSKLKRLSQCSARFDVYHFECLEAAGDDDDENEIVDPGGVIAVLECLARLCRGVAVDPQAGTIL